MMPQAPASQGSFLTKTLGTLMADPPWMAKPFLAAGATTIAGFGAWLNDMMSPALASGGASFLGGFLLGWAFRKTVKLALLVSLALVALVAVLKTTGWIHLEWDLIHADITRITDWVRGKAEGLRDGMTAYLPSAGGAGAGAFFGFRKK